MVKKIAFVTDLHLDEQSLIDKGINSRENWELILADIKSRKIDKVIIGGDIGSPSAHKYFFDSLKQFSDDFKVILGNHDSYNEIKKYFTNYQADGEELFYNYSDNFFDYYFLDTSFEKISTKQMLKLREKLRSNNLNPIIYIHHPVLKVNAPIDLKYPLHNRDELKDILLDYKKEIIIFCGHYHLEDESTYKNIKQIITPACSYQTIKDADQIELDTKKFGYRIINFSDEECTSECIFFINN